MLLYDIIQDELDYGDAVRPERRSRSRIRTRSTEILEIIHFIGLILTR